MESFLLLLALKVSTMLCVLSLMLWICIFCEISTCVNFFYNILNGSIYELANISSMNYVEADNTL